MVEGRGRGRAAERWGKLQKSYFQFENYFRNGNGKDKIKTERQKNTQIYNIFTTFSVLPTSYFSCFFLFAFSHIFHLSHAVLKNLIKLFSFHFGCELTFLFIIALAHVAVLIHCTANGDGRRCEVIAGVGEGGGWCLVIRSATQVLQRATSDGLYNPLFRQMFVLREKSQFVMIQMLMFRWQNVLARARGCVNFINLRDFCSVNNDSLASPFPTINPIPASTELKWGTCVCMRAWWLISISRKYENIA